jgi:hypothetical protein
VVLGILSTPAPGFFADDFWVIRGVGGGVVHDNHLFGPVGSRGRSLEVGGLGVDEMLPSICLILGVEDMVLMEARVRNVILGSGPVLNYPALSGDIQETVQDR